MRPKIDWYRPSTRNIGEALIDPDTSAENIFAKTIGFTFSGEKLLIGFTFSCFPKIWKLGNDFFGEKTAFVDDDVDTDATPTVFRES